MKCSTDPAEENSSVAGGNSESSLVGVEESENEKVLAAELKLKQVRDYGRIWTTWGQRVSNSPFPGICGQEMI